MSPTTSKYIVGQQVKLKSGESVRIIGLDSVEKTYKVMGSDNSVDSVKPDEIEMAEPSPYKDYQQSGPDEQNPDSLKLKQKDVSSNHIGDFIV